MITFNILDSDRKKIMNSLLLQDVFDNFEIRGIEITTITKIEISGILDLEYLEVTKEEIKRNYCIWKEIKPLVLEIVKGKKMPKKMKIIFSLTESKLHSIHENTSVAFLNMNFENGIVNFTTAVGQKEFSMDKSMDSIWDDYIIRFFKKNDFSIEICS